MPRRADKLTDIQVRFIDEYMKDRNAQQAAIRAGYSDYQGKRRGFALLNTPKVRDEVDRRIKKLSDKSQVTAEMVIEGLKKETTSDRASDRIKAWELLGKYLKLFTDKAEVSGPDGQPITVEIRKL